MKAVLVFIFLYMVAGSAAAQQAAMAVPTVTQVATAVNHLTVLEFHEPVTMAAAGSADFQIERQQNKVFVKPLKSGAATDLFVWTQSRRYAYELETTEEVRNMSFAIDNAPVIAPQPVTSPTDEMADLMLTKVLLEAESIQPPRTRIAKDRVSVKVEEVFRTKTSTYLHFSVENKTASAWHVPSPTATYLEPHNEKPRFAESCPSATR
jgi:type IV secretory pathway VirB9-like protein